VTKPLRKEIPLVSLSASGRAMLYQQFRRARYEACEAGTTWLLTFEHWWRIWDRSGLYPLYDTHRLQPKRRDLGYRWRNVVVAPKPEEEPTPEPTPTGKWREHCAQFKEPGPQRVAPVHPIRSALTVDAIDRARREYEQQRRAAKNRGIIWEFTFQSWRKVWDDSGRYGQRGRHVGQYSMQRILDGDRYAPQTVEILVNRENARTMSNKLRYRRGPRIILQGLDTYVLQKTVGEGPIDLQELFDKEAGQE
jgi:hypothetical protein